MRGVWWFLLADALLGSLLEKLRRLLGQNTLLSDDGKRCWEDLLVIVGLDPLLFSQTGSRVFASAPSRRRRQTSNPILP